MAKLQISSGYSRNNLPYMKMGNSPRKLVIFEGLSFTHKPPAGMNRRMNLQMYRDFTSDYTVYVVGRKPGLPKSYSMKDISSDYAVMVRDEIGGPVDIAGLSTGGPPAMWFAVDHRDLVRRLVLLSTGCRLSEYGKQIQMKMMMAAQKGSKRATSAAMADLLAKGFPGALLRGVFWLLGPVMFVPGDSLSDGLAELDAEDKFDFREKLTEIKVPTLVVGGAEDPLYPLRETADGIPGAKLILYPKTGHGAIMRKDIKKDILDFLDQD